MPLRVRQLTAQVDQMAKAGLRVLGVAEAEFAGADLPDSQRAFAFRFLGLVGLADPLRASVPQAVALCRSAGIRVIMITGDYPATAQTIAAQAGLQGNRVIGGTELQAMSDPDLATAVRDVTIFARIMPEQKLRIINALKATGAVVAMTGDGVNDAPSLKAADIGVAMGGRGTDVAREAASIVLLDDDFGSIVTTVRLGRRIYDNLRKAMSFILAVHVPIAGLALMPLLFGMPILFSPVHIAFLEMVIDPVCSLVFEAETEEDGVMRRPPRPPAEPLFSTPDDPVEPRSGAACSGGNRHDLCPLTSIRSGDRPGSRTDLRLAGPLHRRTDPRGPLAVILHHHGNQPSQPGACGGRADRGLPSGSHPVLATCPRPLRFRCAEHQCFWLSRPWRA